MRPIPILAALVALSTLVRAWAGLRIPTPWIAADEMIYAELGRSLWETGHLHILGQDAPFYSLVHPALVGLPLALFDTELGYDVARVLQALVMSLTAVPVFLWGRRLMSDTWALVAAALTLTIPGLAYSGLLMTETVFLPAVTLAAWAMWRVLLAPTPRTQALLLGAVALAVLTRLQGLVLVPVFVLAVLLYAGATRSWTPLRRTAPALGAIGGLAVIWLALGGFGAYGPAGDANYHLADSLRFIAYHAADAVLLVAVVPACALVQLVAQSHKLDPPLRAYLAVTVALTIGLVAEVGIFASRYVGRLAERDLLGLVPVLFLALALWLDRGGPRTRLSASLIALGTVALVLVLPLGRLVHKAALPDAFTLVPVWELGSYEAVVWGFAAAAALAFALLPRGALVALPVALALVFGATSIEASRFAANESAGLKHAFFAGDPEWVDRTATGDVAYFYDGEPHWNAVWEYVFWNRNLPHVYWLEGTKRVPGPLPQERVAPAADGTLAPDPPPFLLASTAFTFFGARAATIAQTGLVQKGLVLWRVQPPLRLSTVLTGVQGSGDVYGPARMTAYACTAGSFALTLVAKGAPVTVVLQSGANRIEHTLAAEEVWSPSLPAAAADGRCVLDVTPSGLVGSTRFEFVRG
ncbi:MAG TPA: glycosyltransferase family 39 protein [Gaiellaceae bacterium]|nr:glycosyltransferase family 39 protein [Gaiellaceae bacterium]